MSYTLRLNERVNRDQRNAQVAKKLADKELRQFSIIPEQSDITRGPSSSYINYLDRNDKRFRTLHAISGNPFHAMVEVFVQTTRMPKRRSLWYANENSTYNEILDGPSGEIAVLSWTHPGFQLALVGELGEKEDVMAHGYTLKSVIPLARAKFLSL